MAYTTIDDPSAYFHTQLYTGTGSELSVTNDANAGDFKPDWIWIKQRNATTNHGMFDSNRGVKKNLKTDSSDAESTENESVKTFNTDGFTLGTSGDYNGSSDTHVAWQWIANGGTTSSNTDGSITSTVQADTTAGFSIVTYTGTGSGATVGHGLGAIPQLVIVKNRSSAQNWRVFHQNAYIGGGYGQYQSGLKLNTTDAADHGANSYWNNDPFTTSTFSVGVNSEVNGSGNSMLAYCFTEKQGYSKFGSYTGNGNADGTFVYTGFKPAWIMTKRTDASSQAWNIQDNKRSPINVQDNFIQTDSDAEASAGGTGIWDSLSNGFKLRQNLQSTNNSGNTFIYMAFAEHPFVSSEGAPITAR